MKLLVTQIEFDFNTDMPEIYGVSEEDEIAITNDNLGILEVDNEDELVDKISDSSGWCVKNIDYTANLLHPLTSYL